MTGHHDYTVRQAANDLRRMRGKQLIYKPDRSRRYHLPAHAALTIAALLSLRDHVIAPILTGVRSPRIGRKPIHYETLRIGRQTLFGHLGIATPARATA